MSEAVEGREDARTEINQEREGRKEVRKERWKEGRKKVKE